MLQRSTARLAVERATIEAKASCLGIASPLGHRVRRLCRWPLKIPPHAASRALCISVVSKFFTSGFEGLLTPAGGRVDQPLEQPLVHLSHSRRVWFFGDVIRESFDAFQIRDEFLGGVSRVFPV